MIAIDTNLLVYAHRQDSPFHQAAAQAVRGLAEGIAPWAIPWPVIYEFYGVVTHPRIYAPPSTPVQAERQIRAWCASPSLHLLADAAETVPDLGLLCAADIRGGAIHDARIALLCRAHQVRELWTLDRDFSRFPWLRVRNPLATG